MNLLKYLFLCALSIISTDLFSQVEVDIEYDPSLEKKAYLKGSGPTICIDNAHGNYHTLEGSFAPFGRLFEADGYKLVSYSEKFTHEALNKCRILVIANPLHPSDAGEWVVPNPSAFDQREIQKLNKWVEHGGRLLLIADHMPFAGAAADLASSFGYEFINGFEQKDGNHWPPAEFKTENNTLRQNAITKGINDEDTISMVATFTGSAFKGSEESEPLLVFPSEYYALTPDTAWRFNERTPRQRLEGWLQGAYQNYGSGKLVVLGEAAMLTAQTVNNFKMGMSSPRAPENQQFALNVIHWLDGVDEYVSAKEIIVGLNEELVEVFNSGEYARLAEFYTEDARIMGPNNQVVEGKDAILNYWKSLEGRGVSWELKVLDVEEREDLIIQIGISRLGVRNNGSTNIFNTKFLLHWELEDGSYKISMDFYQPYR
ncbi:MAG: DUF4440 domain-containing protein [Balneolaceae bacterium]|nr:DUF4440 domain-containing protein [Balneolaceae bacterium]MBO6547022.1 DUF4440 domain-containing protein [Balneolaceae bacterium]MBO6648031.1 DUF4440 domain-containing protein [Balneolaceae bacterium]